MKFFSITSNFRMTAIVLCLSFGQLLNAQSLCTQLFTASLLDSEALNGARFLHQKNQRLHMTSEVMLTAKNRNSTDMALLNQPDQKIMNWLAYLESASAKNSRSESVLAKIKNYYVNLHITKLDQVPNEYYDLQLRIAKEQGHGDLSGHREELVEAAKIQISDQRKSLEIWLDYFFSADSKMYPIWFKYYSFTGMVKLGKFNPVTGVFPKRSAGQMALFPELNREALAMIADALIKKVNGHDLQSIADPTFKQLLNSSKFADLYGRAMQLVTKDRTAFDTTEGKWVLFKRNSKHLRLVQSLQGQNTGWCTAGEATARAQLSEGDFHIYFSNDLKGNATIPRVAIRMSGNEIAEIRGVSESQNLDSTIAASEVLPKKLKLFGSKGQDYFKKTSDMRMLTEISNKTNANIELSIAELKFLYEIDNQIQGFGYEKDPRIAETLKNRNAKKDVSVLFSIRETEVSTTKKESLRKGIKVHYGDLNYGNITDINTLKLPPLIIGSLDLGSLNSANGLVLPRKVTGNLNLSKLKVPTGLVLPEYVGGDFLIPELQSAEGVTLPKYVGGHLKMWNLSSFKGLVLPEYLGGNLEFFIIGVGYLKKQKDWFIFIDHLDTGELASAQQHYHVKIPKRLHRNVQDYYFNDAEGPYNED